MPTVLTRPEIQDPAYCQSMIDILSQRLRRLWLQIAEQGEATSTEV